jgi:hypothetical protein
VGARDALPESRSMTGVRKPNHLWVEASYRGLFLEAQEEIRKEARASGKGSFTGTTWVTTSAAAVCRLGSQPRLSLLKKSGIHTEGMNSRFSTVLRAWSGS